MLNVTKQEKDGLHVYNYNEIYNLSEEIVQSVKEKFRVELEREVNII